MRPGQPARGHGMTFDEIAARLGISVSTARRDYETGLAKMGAATPEVLLALLHIKMERTQKAA